MKRDLYLDAEWFIGGDVFLIGWAFDKNNFGQLYDETLTEEKFQELLNLTTGIIYFYGPDIGIIEKYFDIDIRSNFHCVNLLKVFKDLLPGLKNYKLATIEKIYNIKRNRNEYKANIFRIFDDWRKPQVKSLVLQYNREDVVNLCRLKNIIFWTYDVEDEYLLQVRLAGVTEIFKNYVYLLPADVYRGKSWFGHGNDLETTFTASQLIIRAKFYNDIASLCQMIGVMCDVVRDMKFDFITPVNSQAGNVHLAKLLASGIGKRLGIPAVELITDGNTSCSHLVKGKNVLIVDDVIYKGATMDKALQAVSKQKPGMIYFLAFGKCDRCAY